MLKDSEKEMIMRKGLEAKFSEHGKLATSLMETGSRTLQFIHPDDIFWGTGSFTIGKIAFFPGQEINIFWMNDSDI